MKTSSDLFVGRERELARLSDATSEVSTGQCRVIVVSGDAGMGKTRLVDEVARRATYQGFQVAWGRCWDGGAPALWPWHEALGDLIGNEETDSLLIDDDQATRFGRFTSVRDRLEHASQEQPIALVFDDVHVADATSLKLLEFVARFSRHSRLLLIAICNEAEAAREPAFGAHLASLVREGERVPLAGLSEEEVALLFRSRVGGPPMETVALGVHRASEGNPFFVRELADALVTHGNLNRSDYSLGFIVPRGARQLVERRLSSLDDNVVSVLESAAVIGHDFEIDLLQAMCDTKPDELMAHLGTAVSAGVVGDSGALGRFRFAHVLMREALYEGLPPERRMALHARALEGIKELGGPDGGGRLTALANHYFKAVPLVPADDAIRYLLDAGSHAEMIEAFEEASRLYRRALLVCETAGIGEQSKLEIEERLATVADHLGEHGAGHEKSEFAREGDYWSISYGGRMCRLKDSKGLRYLAELLRKPGVEIHALDLSTPLDPSVRGRPSQNDSSLQATHEHTDEFVDEQARRVYRARLEELQDELEEVRSFGDVGRAAALESEMNVVADHLARALGIGGRPRTATSAPERARVSVTKAIRSAMEKIENENPSLGRHLRRSMNTGLFCSYFPDDPVDWQI